MKSTVPQYFSQEKALAILGKTVRVRKGFKSGDYEVPQGAPGRVVLIRNDGSGWIAELEITFQKQPQFQASGHRLQLNNKRFRSQISLQNAG